MCEVPPQAGWGGGGGTGLAAAGGLSHPRLDGLVESPVEELVVGLELLGEEVVLHGFLVEPVDHGNGQPHQVLRHGGQGHAGIGAILQLIGLLGSELAEAFPCRCHVPLVFRKLDEPLVEGCL